MKTIARLTAASLALVAASVGVGTAQSTPPRLRVLGDADRVTLSKVQGAAFNGSRIVVVTEPEPGVHVFSGAAHRSFGRKGGGPAELKNPVNVAWVGERILTYDMQGAAGKIVSYDPAGRFVSSRSTASCGLAQGLQVTGTDTLLGAVDFGSRRRAIIRLAGARCDTIARYTLPEEIRLAAPGSPGLTLTKPFASGPLWTALPGGRVAVWNGSSPSLMVVNTRGRTVGQFPLPRRRIRLSSADREWWLNAEIPEEFMGQRVFEPLRKKAREDVDFPSYLPVALEFLPDPAGGVWVRQTTAGSGQIWTLVTAAGERASFRLPPGRELLAIGQGEMAARAKDELDVETIEVYRKPGV